MCIRPRFLLRPWRFHFGDLHLYWTKCNKSAQFHSHLQIKWSKMPNKNLTKFTQSSTCGRLSSARGLHQKVISFAFYLGNKLETNLTELCQLTSDRNEYLAGIQNNLENVRKFYPGYSMRVYHNAPLHSRWFNFLPITRILPS